MARIVVVTPNPAVDVTYRVDRQVIGQTHRVREVLRRPGGKGINVVRGLQALGFATVSVLPLGGDPGRWIARSLTELGLDSSVIDIDTPTRTTVTVMDGESHPSLYTEPGPVLEATDWSRLVEAMRRQLDDASMLVISGSLPPHTDTTVIGELVTAAESIGVPAMVDASGDALIAAASAGASVVKPNLQELLEATGETNADRAIASLLGLGARLVVVSKGVQGLVARDPERGYSVAAIPGVHGNPTGAGDAATAGLAAAFVEGRPVPEAMAWAAALGAAAVLRPVAGEVDIAAFHDFLGKNQPTPTN